MSSRPKLLFMCHTLPYPPDGGGFIRSYNVLRLLCREFEVRALCFQRSGSAESGHDIEAAAAALSELCPTEVFPLPQAESARRMIGDHLRSLLRGRVFTVYKHESGAFRQRLEQLLRMESFDLVHLDSLDLSAYLPLLETQCVVCTHHNVESQLFRRRAVAERSWRKWYVGRQAELQAREEKRWCARIAANVVVSDQDGEELRAVVPGAPISVVPNGVDTEFFRPLPGTEEGVVFVGAANWFPNHDAMTFFGDEILPDLRAGSRDVGVTWLGQAPDHLRTAFREKYAVDLTGYVDDVRPHVQNAACYIVPLRVGGGTRLKILDAWAMGKAVVSTAVGCEGLRAEDGVNILIRDDAAGFAGAVHSVLTDPSLRARLGKGARETAENVYSWDVIGKDMNRMYRGLL
jgi:glycosyltransferase involved in cell wall biosynthesis